MRKKCWKNRIEKRRKNQIKEWRSLGKKMMKY
jgi:hypothetical protein